MAKYILRFAIPAHRLDHFQRHGASVRAISPRQYEIAAARFLSVPQSPQVLQKSRSNGDLIRYNVATEEFGVISAKNVIRTYFTPDPAEHGYASNLDYYHAQ